MQSQFANFGVSDYAATYSSLYVNYCKSVQSHHFESKLYGVSRQLQQLKSKLYGISVKLFTAV